jgi:hypothetical protein
MRLSLRIWLICLAALLLTAYSPHPTTWGIVALFLATDPRFAALLSRALASKKRDAENVVQPPADGLGIPLVPIPEFDFIETDTEHERKVA